MLLFHLLHALTPAREAVSSNVVIVIADGLRREEVFGGAEDDLLARADGTAGIRFGQGSREARREALMPFLWGRVAREGEIIGDQRLRSVCQVTNPFLFSYPGYSEMLCGYVDPKVSRNDPIPNPNVTVYEWLNRQPALHGKVAAFGAWGVISAVFNKQRCGFTDVAGYEPIEVKKPTAGVAAANAAKLAEPRTWFNEASDDNAFRGALEYTKQYHPRVLFISLGETDKWAHAARYDRYLDAAHRFDADVAQLWTTLQAIPQYRDDTTLILSCDHGRGTGADWTSHGRKQPNSRYTWMAFLGPGTPPNGDVSNVRATNAQIAATAAAALGYNYTLAQAKAASPIPAAFE